MREEDYIRAIIEEMEGNDLEVKDDESEIQKACRTLKILYDNMIEAGFKEEIVIEYLAKISTRGTK